MSLSAAEYIKHLQLQTHPEGGFYKETYRSDGIISRQCLSPQFSDARHYATAIYYLLQENDYSGFHRIKSDECWHFYDGGTLLIHVLQPNGNYSCIRLGRNIAAGEQLQFVVPARAWFASEPAPGVSFTLAGCTVAPGFDFADFELGKRNNLMQQFVEHSALIMRLCRL